MFHLNYGKMCIIQKFKKKLGNIDFTFEMTQLRTVSSQMKGQCSGQFKFFLMLYGSAIE